LLWICSTFISGERRLLILEQRRIAARQLAVVSSRSRLVAFPAAKIPHQSERLLNVAVFTRRANRWT